MSEEHTVVENPAVRTVLMAVTWLWVGVPFAYGVYSLMLRVPALFGT